MKEIDVLSTNEDIAKILASRLKRERLSQSLKQEELALMADVKPHVVRNLEQHSKISLDNLISIMRALRKTDVFETMFDFEKARIEVDAFTQNTSNKKHKQRVYDAK